MATNMTADTTSPARAENVGGGATLPIAASDVTGLLETQAETEEELLDHENRIHTLEEGGGGGSVISDVSVKFAGPFRDEHGGKWTFSSAVSFLEVVTSTAGASPIIDLTGHVMGVANRVYRLQLQLLGGDWTQDTGSSSTPGNEILVPIDASLGIPIAGFLGSIGVYQDAGHSLEPCVIEIPAPSETPSFVINKFDLSNFGVTGHASTLVAPLLQFYEKA